MRTIKFYRVHYDWAPQSDDGDSWPIELETDEWVIECPGEFVRWCDVQMHTYAVNTQTPDYPFELRIWETPARQAANAIRSEYLGFKDVTNSDWAGENEHSTNLYGTDWREVSAHFEGEWTDAEMNRVMRMVDWHPPFCTKCHKFHYPIRETAGE